MNKHKLKILLAGPRGFCAGVDRAIEIVRKSIDKFGAPVYVRHEIVHNKHVVESLKKIGAVFVEELSEIKDKTRPVIFSAHGVPKSVPAEAEDLNMNYVDATCPLVSKVHREAENLYKSGNHILLIGHKNHPEVIGTLGQLPDGAIDLIESIEDVEKYNNENKNIAYVTQTTLSVDDTKDIALALNKKFPSIENPKKEDICYATTNRQEEVKRLVKHVDLMLVVGSENSSNSQRLVEVAKDGGCTKAYLIEDYKKIDWGKVAESSSIGITSGASAPDHLVKEVISRIQEKFDTNLVYDTTRKETIEFKVPPVLR